MAPGDSLATRYRIDAVVGVGGMGIVHRGVELSTGSAVAIKTLLNVAPGAGLGRFAREAQILAGLRHPGVVSYLAHDPHADPPWLAMEWLDGEDLSHRIARGPLPLDLALSITRDVLDALAHLHEHGIVHRDLKPSNVFLVGDGSHAKLIDLGIARVSDPDATALTKTGGVLGTPLYMSPEQARGEVADERADVWAAGAVLFEMLVGEAPFHAATALGVLSKILMGEVPRLAERLPGISPAVDFAVDRALSRDRAIRPTSARELLKLLTAIDAHAATVAARAPTAERRFTFVLFAEPSAEGRWLDLRTSLEAMGGHVEPVRGGFLVARFSADRPGGAEAHLCARAVAVVLRSDPQARVAVALAHTTAGDAIDDILERGSALLASGRPGEIVCDADTAAVLGPLMKDGDGRLRVIAGDSTQLAASNEQGPILGRESELSRIEGICRTILDERSPSAVVIVAEPGIGKTRLMRGLQERLSSWSPPPLVIECRGEPQLTDAPFASVRAALQQLPSDMAQTAAFLALLDERSASTDDGLDPAQWRTRLGGAFEAWARAEGGERMLVLELEDLHWIDNATLDLVTRLLGASDLACLLLATARPEIDDRFPKLFDGLPAERVDLRPLSAKAAERLVRALLPALEQPVADVVARAGGNPLFLRELSRVVSAGGGVDALPTSLAFVIQARIDALPATVREVCRVAATFGDRSWVEGIEYVLGRHCAADVLALQRAEIQRPTPSSLGEYTELAFRHALFRETAERMTREEDARAYHARILEWLTPRSKQLEVLAFHAQAAGLDGMAAGLFGTAARDASRAHQLTEAVTHWTRALQLGVAANLGADVLLDWLQPLGNALLTTRTPTAAPTLESALTYIDAVGSVGQRVSARLAVASGMSGTFQYARADELYESIERLDGSAGTSVATMLLQQVRHRVVNGRFHDAQQLLDRVRDRRGDDDGFDFFLMQAQVAAGLGNHAGVEAALASAQARVPEAPAARIEFLKVAALVHYFAGDDATFAARSIAAAEEATVAGLLYQEAVLLHNAGDAFFMMGDSERARSALRRSSAIARDNGYEMLAGLNRVFLGYLDANFNAADAVSAIEESARFVRAIGGGWAAAGADLVLARAFARTGDRPRARAIAERVGREALALGHVRLERDVAMFLAEVDETALARSFPPASAASLP